MHNQAFRRGNQLLRMHDQVFRRDNQPVRRGNQVVRRADQPLRRGVQVQFVIFQCFMVSSKRVYQMKNMDVDQSSMIFNHNKLFLWRNNGRRRESPNLHISRKSKIFIAFINLFFIISCQNECNSTIPGILRLRKTIGSESF